VFDVARIIALLVAGAACLRPKYPLGLIVIFALAVVDAFSIVVPLVHRAEAPPSAFYAFVLVFWGPSGMPMPRTSVASLNLLGDHPVARTAMTSCLAWTAAKIAFRHAEPLRPETAEARLWADRGLRFTFVAVFDALLVVAGMLVAYLG
jgi:hypothetical protein